MPNDSLQTHGRRSLARLSDNLTQNLGLFFAFLATAFAGWSGYEAHKSRLETHLDTVTSLRLANRSYAVAEDPEIAAAFPVAEHTEIPIASRPLAKTLEQQLMARHTIKIYGTAPAFQVTVVADCKVGLIGTLINKPGGIREADVKTPPLALPSTMMPGAVYQLQEHCTNDPSGITLGAVIFGVIHYKDVFGLAHYTHFCYDNPFIIAEAIGNPDPKKWNQNALTAGKHLVPCENFNDADLPNIS